MTIENGAQASPRESAARLPRRGAFASPLLALLPLAGACAFMLAFGVDVPYHDEWNQTDGVVRMFEGKRWVPDLWAPHNEHVAFFDHAAILSIARISHFNLRAAMAATVCIAAFTLVMLALLLRRPGSHPWWSLPLASCFVFSLHAIENWLWGGQIQLAITVAGVTGALCTLVAEPLRPAKLAAAIGLGFFGSYSFLAGFLVWPLGAVLLLVRPFAQPGSKARALGAWLLSGGLAIGFPILFYPSGQFSASAGFSVSRILEFVSCYVGAGLIGQWPDAPGLRALGWTGIAVLVAGSLWIALRRRSSPVALAIATIGLFGLGTGCMIALGRGATSLVQSATSSRYTTFSSLCWIAIALMPWLVTDRPPGRGLRLVRGAWALAILAALLAPQPARVAEGRKTAEGRATAVRALRTGEGMSLPVLAAAFDHPLDWLPQLHDRLAGLRRNRLSLFRKASAGELQPAPMAGPFVVTLARAPAGRVEARGGVPGNVAIAVFTRDGVPTPTEMTLDATGSASATIDLGPAPVPSNAVFTAFTLDREGRIVQAAPTTVPR